MTEDQWLTSTDPQVMLDWLITEASDRKLRLLGVAACRRIWGLLAEGLQGREAVEVAELFADGLVGEGKRSAAEEVVMEYADSLSPNTEAWVGWVGLPGEAWAAHAAANTVCELASRARLVCLAARTAKAPEDEATRGQEGIAQTHLIREIFGNPFRPLPHLAPSVLRWSDGLIKRFAEAAYQHRTIPAGTLDLQRLAVLADALEDTGVTDQDILEHLRQQGAVHVRGCAVLDWLLGKE